MVVRLTGVIEDGSPPSLSIGDPRTALRVPRGTTLVILMAVVTRSGAPVPAASVDAATLTIRRAPQGEVLVRKTGVAAPAEGANVFQFTLTSSDTSTAVDPTGNGGRVLMDAKVARSGAVDFPIPLSSMFIEPSVGA